jgi:hypothetical protein
MTSELQQLYVQNKIQQACANCMSILYQGTVLELNTVIVDNNYLVS